LTAANPEVPGGAGGDPASAAAAATPSAVPEADFLQRAQQNPQWASEQVRQFQSAADRAEAARTALVEQYEPVRALIDQYDAKTVAAAVENYRAVRSSEAFGEAIQEFERTGQLPTRKGSEPTVDNDDEYKTPEEQRMDALEARLNAAESNTSANTLASGRTVLQGHIETVLSEYGFTPEDSQKMQTTMTQQFDAWQNSGPAGLAAMKSIMNASGLATVKGIMLSAVSADALRAAAVNATSAKRKGLERLATDGPSGIPSSGREPPPEFAEASSAVAGAWARENPDLHDSY